MTMGCPLNELEAVTDSCQSSSEWTQARPVGEGMCSSHISVSQVSWSQARANSSPVRKSFGLHFLGAEPNIGVLLRVEIFSSAFGFHLTQGK